MTYVVSEAEGRAGTGSKKGAWRGIWQKGAQGSNTSCRRLRRLGHLETPIKKKSCQKQRTDKSPHSFGFSRIVMAEHKRGGYGRAQWIWYDRSRGKAWRLERILQEVRTESNGGGRRLAGCPCSVLLPLVFPRWERDGENRCVSG